MRRLPGPTARPRAGDPIPEDPAAAYAAGRADERAKIAWWLAAGIAGPGGMHLTEGEADLLRGLLDRLRGDGGQWADAPPIRR